MEHQLAFSHEEYAAPVPYACRRMVHFIALQLVRGPLGPTERVTTLAVYAATLCKRVHA